MAFNWNGFTPALTQAQQTALTYFENLGSTGPGNGNFTEDPEYTYAQSRAARALLIDMERKVEAARRGVRMVMDYYIKKNEKAFIDANQ